MSKDDLYHILGVSKNSSQDDIKKAYKKKAMEYHPDKTNGDKAKEEHFKKINEAYGVLNDPKKKQMYDQFGVVDGQQGGGGAGVDIGDIFANMFGGGGMPGMRSQGPGGFSFVFMGDDNQPDDIFRSFFEGGMPNRRQPRPCDTINVPVDISDIYYGRVKKVEFELLDQCNKCQGSGAADPSCVIKCMACNGQGKMSQQMGPFFVQTMMCGNCGGQGTTIKNNKVCQGCKGQKTMYAKKYFELNIPKGIPNGHEVRMDGKGAYDEQIQKNRDIVFKFHWDIKPPYMVDQANMNVIYEMQVPLEDILAGFERKVTVYNEEFTFKADHYLNPSKRIVLDEMGLFDSKKKKNGDLILNIKVDFSDNDKLVKYNDILRKIFKRPAKEEKADTEEKNVINLTR